MPLNVAELQVIIGADVGAAEKGLRSVEESVKRVSGTSKLLNGLSAALRGVVQGLSQFGFTAAGVQSLVSAMSGLTRTLFATNASYEMVRAQLQAFTGSAEEAARIFAWVREEAAKTPFAFESMAEAAVMLLPSAKAAGKQLSELIKTAEILAALNPAQGLTGAAFALREALSGDFISLVERFNLPRQYINQLKAEGVPAIEIVTRVLNEMGASAELVGLMASTARGRWSTFIDVISQVKASTFEALFLKLSSTLSEVTEWLTQNQARFEEFAGMIGERLASAFVIARDAVITFLQALAGNWQDAPGQIRDIHRLFGMLGLTVRATVVPALQAGRAALNEFLAGFRGTGEDSFLAKLGEGVRNTVLIIETNLPKAKKLLTDIAETVKSELIPAWDEFRARVEPVIDTISSKLPTLVPAVAGVTAAFVGLSIAGAGLNALIGPILGVIGALKGLTAVTGIVSTIVGLLGGPVTAAILAVAATLGVGYLAWTQNWFGMRDTVNQFWTQIQPIVENVKNDLANAWETITTALQSAANAFEQVWNAVAPLAGEAFQAVLSFGKEVFADWRAWAEDIAPLAAQAWENVKSAAVIAMGMLKATIIPVLSMIVNFFRRHGDELRTIVESAWGILKAVIMTIMNTIQNIITIVLALIAGDWRAAWEGMKRLVGDIWNGIKTIVLNVLKGLEAGLSIGLNTLKGILSVAWDKLKEVTTDTWDTLKRTVLRAVDGVKDAIGGIKDKALEALSRAKEWLVQTGQDLVQGLINGIRAMADRVVDALTGVVKGAVDSAKRMLGIKSPSRVFFQIGINIGEGLTRGLARVRDAVEQASAGLGEVAVESMGRELERAQAAVSLLRDFASAVQQYLDIAERWTAVQRAGRRDWSALFSLIEQVARGGIGQLRQVTLELSEKALSQARDALEATRAVLEVVNILLDISGRLQQGLPRASFADVFDWLSEFSRHALLTLSAVADELGGTVLARAQAIAELVKSVGEVITGTLDLTARWAQEGAVVSRLWDELAAWYEQVARSVTEAFVSLSSTFSREALEHASQAIQVIQQFAEAVTSIIEALDRYQEAQEQLGAVDSMLEWFSAFADRVVRTMAQVAVSLGQALTDAQKAATTISDIVRALQDALEAVSQVGLPSMSPMLVPASTTARVAETLTQSPIVNVDVKVMLDERELKGVIKQVILEVLTR